MSPLIIHVRIFAEYDVFTGCKLSSVDIGASVVRLGYSPAGGHVIVAALEVGSADFFF